MNKKNGNIRDHKIVGRVHDIQLSVGSSQAFLLVKRDDPNHTPIVLGQFVLLMDPEDREKGFLCVAEEYKPDLPFNINTKEAIRQSNKHRVKIDQMYKEDLLFLGYRCRLLGVCKIENETVKYYSNVRSVPSVHQLVAAIPSAAFMESLFTAAVSATDNEDGNVIFELGYLKYGTNPDDTDCYPVGTPDQVSVLFNVTNMMRKRTAIFGKSGYGKSNTVKACIGMIAREKPHCGQLILDTNGEYGLDNDQNQGFMDIFYDAGMKDKVVMYTNKNFLPKTVQKHGKNIRPLKFDVFLNIRPAFEIVEASLAMKEPPLYLQSWFAALNSEESDEKLFQDTNNPGLVYAIYYCALLRAGLKPCNKKSRVELNLRKAWIDHLATRRIRDIKRNDPNNIEADFEEKEFTIEELGSEKKSFLDGLGIVETKTGRGNVYITNEITTMAAYANFWDENFKKEDSSLKGFSEILYNYRRFYGLATFHQKNEENEGFSISLGESVFNDLRQNKIVIIDLASVSIKVAKSLSKHIAAYILNKASYLFGNDNERKAFREFDALIYIEESQNYLGKEEISSGNSIYERLAKEGRKFHLGLVYVTQQPSAIDQSITSQTENIIALHMSNETDCFILNKIKDKFDPLTCRFLKDEAAKGLAYTYAEPHQPFVLPCQIKEFNAQLIVGNGKKSKK